MDVTKLLEHLLARGVQQQLPRHDVGGGGQSEGLKRATNLTLNFGIEKHFLFSSKCDPVCNDRV